MQKAPDICIDRAENDTHTQILAQRQKNVRLDKLKY